MGDCYNFEWMLAALCMSDIFWTDKKALYFCCIYFYFLTVMGAISCNAKKNQVFDMN